MVKPDGGQGTLEGSHEGAPAPAYEFLLCANGGEEFIGPNSYAMLWQVGDFWSTLAVDETRGTDPNDAVVSSNKIGRVRQTRWPTITAVVGLITTVVCLFADAITERRMFSRYDYAVIGYVVLPGLFLGLILAFVGTVALAPRLEKATRIAIAFAVFFICLLTATAPLNTNIHGFGALLAFVVIAAVGIVLLVMAAFP